MSIDYTQFPIAKARVSALAGQIEKQHARESKERGFKRTVIDRDEGCCRKCGCRTIRRLQPHPRRGEVHHVHGRDGSLKYDERGGILLCSACHEAVTYNRVLIVATRRSIFFVWTDKAGRQHKLLNCYGPVKFEEAA